MDENDEAFDKIFGHLSLTQKQKNYLYETLYRKSDGWKDRDSELYAYIVEALEKLGATDDELYLAIRCIAELHIHPQSSEDLDMWLDEKFAENLLPFIRNLKEMGWNNAQIIEILAIIAFPTDGSYGIPSGDIIENTANFLKICQDQRLDFKLVKKTLSEIDPLWNEDLVKLARTALKHIGFTLEDVILLASPLSNIDLVHGVLEKSISGIDIAKEEIQLDIKRHTEEFREVMVRLLVELKELEASIKFRTK